MKNKRLNNGFSIPSLGMGSWCFGGRESRDPDNDDIAQIDAIRYGLESGYSLIDTAEYYADGYAETLIGKAISGFDRQKLFLTSKVWKTHLGYNDVISSAQRSLERLGTGYLDLYLYHQVSESVPLEETISAMNELVSRKLVKYIGVSNFAPERLARAIKCSSAPIVLDQVHYSLTVREAELELLEFCRENDVMLQAWRPQRGVADCELTRSLCRKYNCTLPQLALAFLINQEQVVTITASSDKKHLDENLRAVDIVLEKADLARLTEEMPDKKMQGTVPLS